MNIPEAVKFLRAAQKRITPQRKLLLRIISDNAHLDASEIYRLAKEKDEKISLPTVYRTVNLLKELGLVEASDLGEDHYHYEVHLDEHYHLICLGCGKVIEMPPVATIRELGEERGFEVVGAKVELTGYCKKCRRKRYQKEKGSSRTQVTERLSLTSPVTRTIDLRGVPLIKHPERVSRALKQLEVGELLEIITQEKERLEMASKMLEMIEGAELVKLWQDKALCHAVVRKQGKA